MLSARGPLEAFDPLVREWFADKFADVTEPQRLGWPEIQAGHDVLISAPTGSGKTLAAFLTAIDSLVRQARAGELPNQTQILYVSPLKALSNDIHKNLDIPLAGIAELAADMASRSPRSARPCEPATRPRRTPADGARKRRTFW